MSSRLVLVPALLLALASACVLAAPASADAEALKRGSRGPLVAQVQQKLGVPADGVFGPQTGHAVRRFQARKGLTSTASSVRRRRTRSASTSPRAAAAAGGRPAGVPPASERIAQCESGGNPRAVSSDGTYRGKYQFDRQTWHAMGGHGDPARASETEQDRRALTLYRARGTSPWPACGA